MSKHDWEKDAAEIDGIVDPEMREAVRKMNTRAREQAEALERAAKMKRPSGHTPAVARVYELVAANRDMMPAELWDKFGGDPKLIGLGETNFKKRAGEARAEIRKSGRLEK